MIDATLNALTLLKTILCKFGQICATGNAFVRLMPITKMHLLLGSRSERGGARRAPTKRVFFISEINPSSMQMKRHPIANQMRSIFAISLDTNSQRFVILDLDIWKA